MLNQKGERILILPNIKSIDIIKFEEYFLCKRGFYSSQTLGEAYVLGGVSVIINSVDTQLLGPC